MIESGPNFCHVISVRVIGQVRLLATCGSHM